MTECQFSKSNILKIFKYWSKNVGSHFPWENKKLSYQGTKLTISMQRIVWIFGYVSSRSVTIRRSRSKENTFFIGHFQEFCFDSLIEQLWIVVSNRFARILFISGRNILYRDWLNDGYGYGLRFSSDVLQKWFLNIC